MHSTTSDIASLTVAALNLFSCFCLMRIVLPQGRALWARHGRPDRLRAYRFLTALSGLAFSALLFWRAMLWTDAVIFNQTLLGPPTDRWPIELLIGLALAGVSWFGQHVYHRAESR